RIGLRQDDGQVMMMNEGEIIEIANSDEIYKHPKMPYTQRRLAAIPKAGMANVGARMIDLPQRGAGAARRSQCSVQARATHASSVLTRSDRAARARSLSFVARGSPRRIASSR